MAQNFVDVAKTKEEQQELLVRSGLTQAQARHCVQSVENYSAGEASEADEEGMGGRIINAPLGQEAVIVPRPGASGNVSIPNPQKELKI